MIYKGVSQPEYELCIIENIYGLLSISTPKIRDAYNDNSEIPKILLNKHQARELKEFLEKFLEKN